MQDPEAALKMVGKKDLEVKDFLQLDQMMQDPEAALRMVEKKDLEVKDFLQLNRMEQNLETVLEILIESLRKLGNQEINPLAETKAEIIAKQLLK